MRAPEKCTNFFKNVMGISYSIHIKMLKFLYSISTMVNKALRTQPSVGTRKSLLNGRRMCKVTVRVTATDPEDEKENDKVGRRPRCTVF